MRNGREGGGYGASEAWKNLPARFEPWSANAMCSPASPRLCPAATAWNASRQKPLNACLRHAQGRARRAGYAAGQAAWRGATCWRASAASGVTMRGPELETMSGVESRGWSEMGDGCRTLDAHGNDRYAGVLPLGRGRAPHLRALCRLSGIAPAGRETPATRR
jgi:hypothetical protein